MIKVLFIALVLLFITSGVSLAQEVVETSTSAKPSVPGQRAAKKEAITQNKTSNTSDRLANGIERGVKEIDRRVESLDKLIEKINAMKKLSSSSKSTFVSQIQSQIDSLEALKVKIQADTDLTTLKKRPTIGC